MQRNSISDARVYACRASGALAASFEVKDDPVAQDILSGLGFAYGLSLTLRLFRNATLCALWRILL